MKRQVPPKIAKRFLTLEQVLDLEDRALFAEEAVVFINQHGMFCEITNDNGLGTTALLRTIAKKLLAERYFIHVGSCSFLKPNCSNADGVLRLVPRLSGISGFQKDITASTAESFELDLLQLLMGTKQINYQTLLAIKASLMSDLAFQTRKLGFRMLLN